MKAGASAAAGAHSPGSISALSFRLLAVLLLCLVGVGAQQAGGAGAARRVVDVGVILDRTTWLGNMSWASMELALEDFYADASHAGYGTKVRLHLRDTPAGHSAVAAASAGVDLLKNVRVQAIVGPQTSTQAKFLAELGNKSSVPIISFSANSPSRSSSQTPYFIRTAWNDSCQAEAIASLVQKYNWREVVPIVEDDDSNTRFIPDLVDALGRIDTRVPCRYKIRPSAGEDEIKRALSSLKGNWTSVFVVRMSYQLALKFFRLAKEERMMDPGFVWITAYGLTDIFTVAGYPALDVMEGVVGIEPYVQETEKLNKFRQRWREKYRLENPGTSINEPIMSGLYAYDTVWAVALAAEKAGYVNSDFVLSETNNGSTDFDKLSSSRAAEKFRNAFLKVNFTGISGQFLIQDMQFQLVSTTYKIINVAGRERIAVGVWTPGSNISISTIVWPGGSEKTPRGWLLPVNKELKIGVPVKPGFGSFIRSENGTPKGFCIDVFEEVIRKLPYNVPKRYVEFGNREGESNGTYDELVYKVYLKQTSVTYLSPSENHEETTCIPCCMRPILSSMCPGRFHYSPFTTASSMCLCCFHYSKLLPSMIATSASTLIAKMMSL